MNGPLNELDKSIGYLKNTIVHCAGDISYNSSTGTVSWEWCYLYKVYR